ncbi:MAG: prephenate dehydrogenase [bacterium]
MKRRLRREKIAILGVGLLGGSLALALRKNKNVDLMGWTPRPSSRRKASKILPMARHLSEALKEADVILICSHSGEVFSLLKEIPAANAAEGALILDVSSVKEEIVRMARSLPWAAGHFVPCHPMAGKEKSGVENAEAGLYAGKTVFVTPLPKTPRVLVNQAAAFWKSVGGCPVILSARRHDEYVALTSHLPHLLASALVNLYGSYQKQRPAVSQALGNGFKDTTRIAGGSPSMWVDILKMNKRNILSFLFRYREDLLRLERKIRKGNGRDWNGFFERARKIRKDL